MALVLSREINDDGSVVVTVAADATTQLTVHVPRWADVAGFTQAVADTAVGRYLDRKRQLKGDSR